MPGRVEGEYVVAESVIARVRRIISASIEDAVDAAERAGGAGVMREAIREVDAVIDDARAEHGIATTRRLQSARQARLFRDRLASLDDKARFALGEGREDLAEAAISRQIDFEAQAAALEKAETEAGTEVVRLDECLTALRARKAEMEEALGVFELAQRDAASSARPPARSEHRVERAEAAFERAMNGVGYAAGSARADGRAAAKVAEIDALQRNAIIAQRLASLRASPTA